MSRNKPGDISSATLDMCADSLIRLKSAFDKIAMVNVIMLNIKSTHFIFSREDYLCL